MTLPRHHRSPFILLPLAAVCTLASATSNTPARADLILDAPRTPGIWQGHPLATELAAPVPAAEAKSTVTRQEFVQATMKQVPLLGRLQNWRDTLRGTGARQEWQFAPEARLQIGKQALPAYSLLSAGKTAPAVSAQWGRFSAGSTAPLRALNQSLRDMDAWLAESAPAATRDETQLTWLAARPLQTKTADLNLLLARGRRDLTPTSDDNKRIVEGDWMGASGRLAFSPAWKMSGEWMQSKLAAGTADAWKLALGGPISHPWGVARLDATYTDTEEGFAAWRDGSAQAGVVARKLALLQDVAVGDVRGSTRIALQQQLWTGEGDAVAGAPSNTVLESAAKLQWKLSPSLALTGSHVRRDAWRHLPHGVYSARDANRAEAARVESDAGAEWKLSSSLALTASAGVTRAEGALPWDADDPYVPFTLQDEERLALGLRHRTRDGSWQLQVKRAETDDPFAADSAVEIGTVSLQAERQLLPWLRLKAGFDRGEQLSALRQAALDQWQRRAEAQLSLDELGRLSLLYSDSLSADAGAQADTDAREYGVRYQIGQGAGLSLSMEYSRRLQPVQDDEQWRVGLTYR